MPARSAFYTRFAAFACIVVALGCAGRFAAAETLGLYYVEPGPFDAVGRLLLTPDVASGTDETLLSLPEKEPRAVAVDELHGKVYYADGVTIGRANLDGSSPETIVIIGAAPGDIEVDPVGGKIYYSTLFGAPEGIYSADLDGGGVTAIHTPTSLAAAMEPATVTLRDVYNISIDTDAGRLYWTADDGGVAGRIALNSSPLGGGGVTQHFIASGRPTAITKMDIDFDTDKLYYTVGSTTNEVRRSNLDNSSVETLVSGLGRPHAVALDLDNDDLFFNVDGRVYQSDLDGAVDGSQLLNGASGFVIFDMEIGPSVPEPGTLALLVAGLAALGWRRSKRWM